MDDNLKRVDEFHRAFRIAQPSSPRLPDEPRAAAALESYARDAAELGRRLKAASADAGGSTLLVRLQLIQEELAELAAGFMSRDLVEVADALSDLSYVVDGTWLVTGLAPRKEACLVEVHGSNMSKLGPGGEPIIGASGRVEKGPGYFAPDLALALYGPRREPLGDPPRLDGWQSSASSGIPWLVLRDHHEAGNLVHRLRECGSGMRVHEYRNVGEG